MKLKFYFISALIGLSAVSCRQADAPAGPGGNARVEVTSDPSGAQIFLDGTNTGKVTPDLLRDLIGLHEVLVRMDRDGVTYGYRTNVDVKGDSLHKIYGPLTMRCTTETCSINFSRYHTLGTLRISSNPNGSLFNYDAGQTNKGLLYPAGFTDAYVSLGTPVIAMLAGARDTLGLGIYNSTYLAGRPAPAVTQLADKFTLRQQMWVVPPTDVIVTGAPTARGIQVDEELIGVSATSDVAYLKLTFTNITNKASYQAADPIVPLNGLKYDSVYIGFAMDPDIGTHNDDMISYAPELDMVYAYDMDFSEPLFGNTTATKPAFVGLKIMSASSAGRVLNAWAGGNDYKAGDITERFGWSYLSGRKSQLPDYPGTQIGYVPVNPGDYRIAVTAGPLTLAPGASANITVAIIMAQPVAGTYQSGNVVLPGDPLDQNRMIARIAALLLERARNLINP